MPILALIVTALATAFAMMVLATSIGPFLKIRALHNATVTPIGSLVKGSRVTVRGKVTEARRPPQFPRMSPGEIVFSQLEVIEQVGKQRNVVFKGTNAQVFRLEDARGGTIDIEPRNALLIDGRDAVERLDRTPLEFRNWMSGQGSFAYQKTPASCIESALWVGAEVSISGQVILPMPGAVRAGDTETQVIAREVAVLGRSPWAGPSGRTLLIGLIATPIGLAASLGCVLWAGIL